MNIEIGKTYLLTTSAWFFAPDGRTYRAAFGTVHGIHSSEETLGLRTNAKSTNWYVQIGALTIAGCQIEYAVQTDECDMGQVADYKVTEQGECVKYFRPSDIFDADDVR